MLNEVTAMWMHLWEKKCVYISPLIKQNWYAMKGHIKLTQLIKQINVENK